MRDPRWERDTLFMVFEEDFRFTADDLEPVVMKTTGLQEVVGDASAQGDDAPHVPLDGSNTAAPPMQFVVFLSLNAVEPSATAANNTDGIACVFACNAFISACAAGQNKSVFDLTPATCFWRACQHAAFYMANFCACA